MNISGFVSLPRIPAIIRLRTSGETISVTDAATSGRPACSGASRCAQEWRPVDIRLEWQLHLLLAESKHVGPHLARDCFYDRHRDRISKLLVRGRIRYRNYERPSHRTVEAHEPRAFARRQPSRPLPRLTDQNLGSVLVISRGQCSRDVFLPEEAISRTVPFLTMLLRVAFKIGP